MSEDSSKFSIKQLPKIFKSAFKNITPDHTFIFSAALSYYGVFALPAVLFLVIYIAGLVVGAGEVQDQIMGKLGAILGEKAQEQMGTMIEERETSGSSIWITLLGFGILLLSASVAISHLQEALNRIWLVKIDPDAGIKVTILERIKTIGVVIGLGILMLAFLIVTSFFTAFSDTLTEGLPDFVNPLFFVLNFLISFGFIWLLFGVLFKVVPDVEISYSTVWIGAAITAFLFVLGQFALSIYLSKAAPGESFGAAGPIIVIMVWMYYSAFITLLGAEVTKEYVKHTGRQISPSKHALKMNIELEK